ATGLMNWVMGKALPEDVPIDSRMVSRAIERAQGTVEARNAEIRKDVLKYDEVMNEQRKVIYRRRQQILDGESLRDQAFESLATALQHAVETFCLTDFAEDWDLDGLMNEVTTYYPTRFSAPELTQAHRADEIFARCTMLMAASAEDFVKYVMHLDVVVEPSAEPNVRNVQYSAPEDPVPGSGGMIQAAAMEAAEAGEEFTPELADEPEIAQVIKG